MLEKQNVTLSIPKTILRKAKIMAVEQDTSLSGLMIELLTNLVEKGDKYADAKRTYLACLAQNTDLGTGGTMNWTRESLHDR